MTIITKFDKPEEPCSESEFSYKAECYRKLETGVSLMAVIDVLRMLIEGGFKRMDIELRAPELVLVFTALHYDRYKDCLLSQIEAELAERVSLGTLDVKISKIFLDMCIAANNQHKEILAVSSSMGPVNQEDTDLSSDSEQDNSVNLTGEPINAGGREVENELSISPNYVEQEVSPSQVALDEA